MGGTCSLLAVLVLLVFVYCMLRNLYLSIRKNLNLKVFHLLFPLLAFNCIYLVLLASCPIHEGIDRQYSDPEALHASSVRPTHLCACSNVFERFQSSFWVAVRMFMFKQTITCSSIRSFTSSQKKR